MNQNSNNSLVSLRRQHAVGLLKSRALRYAGVLLMVAMLGRISELDAQSPAEQITESAAGQDAEFVELSAEFDKIQEEFRNYVLESQRIGITYLNSPTLDEAEPYIKKFSENFEKGNEVLERWIPVGEKLFASMIRLEIKPNDDIITFMSKVMEKRFRDYQFESCFEIAEKLQNFNPKNARAGFYYAKAGLMTNRFGPDVSRNLERFKEHFQSENALSEAEKIMVSNIFYLQTEFEKEKLIRKKEAAADDLPRVLFKTTKGEFTIELFENEAPETVANFIYLVESGHYNGLVIDTVIENTAAQTGKFDKDFNVREIGYTIKDEYDRDDARKIFAGSLVMLSPQPNSSDSIFFVSMASLVNMHGRQTVFGRIYSGMDIVYSLNKTFKIKEEKQIPIDDSVPDKILTATVLRKRDHEYKPQKITK